MGYVENILDANESIEHRGNVHWIVYGPAIFFLLVLGLTIVGARRSNSETFPIWVLVSVTAFLFALTAWVNGFVRRWTTELVVTNQRVIVKTGLIRRDTEELNRNRVEGVSVKQSVLGRMLNYGTISVQGTGGGLAPVKTVKDPLTFRRAVRP